MRSLAPELYDLARRGVIDRLTAARLRAIEERRIFSLQNELRLLSYAAVLLIAAGAAVFIARNLDRLGPITITASIALASLACYAWSYWRRSAIRNPQTRNLSEYVLLLAALLLSAAIGYAESQFHLLGDDWTRHFLLLAVVHAVTAYAFRSRLVLSASIAALASWFGIERNVERLFDSNAEMGARALACAAAVFAWRSIDLRARMREETRPFTRVFDHAAANLAMFGAVLWCFDETMQLAGLLLVAAGAVILGRQGLHARSDLFLVYAVVWTLIGVDGVVLDHLTAQVLELLWLVATTVGAIVVLFVLRARMARS